MSCELPYHWVNDPISSFHALRQTSAWISSRMRRQRATGPSPELLTQPNPTVEDDPGHHFEWREQDEGFADTTCPVRPQPGNSACTCLAYWNIAEAGFDDIRPAAAALAHVRKQTMAQAVEQLERTGYVERRPNPQDRRSRLVFLTERGASVRPVTHAAAARVEKRWKQLMGRDELEALRASLLGLLGELRAR